MENVPDVIYKKNIKAFSEWLAKLENLGYKCYWKILNSKDYGIPQNRERCFMVSIQGDYFYEFPKPIMLERKLQELLEDEVDEKYYLTKRAIIGRAKTKVKIYNFKNSLPKDGICPSLTATDYKRPKLVQFVKTSGGGGRPIPRIIVGGKAYKIVKITENFIQWYQKGMLEQKTRAWRADTVAPTLTTHGDTLIIEFGAEDENRIKKQK